MTELVLIYRMSRSVCKELWVVSPLPIFSQIQLLTFGH